MQTRNRQIIASDEVFVKSPHELDSFRIMQIYISFSTTWVIVPLPLLRSKISNHIFINMASWIQCHLFAVQMPHLCISEELPKEWKKLFFKWKWFKEYKYTRGRHSANDITVYVLPSDMKMAPPTYQME